MDTKKCSRCGEIKPIEQFHRNRNTKDGRTPDCAKCRIPLAAAWNKVHPEYHRQKAKEFKARNPEKHADWSLRWRLGLPVGTYAKMFAAQNGKCAICGTTDPGGRTKRFHVDHDEKTGLIRGLLCNACNLGIGKLGHDTSIIEAAITYLTRTYQYSTPCSQSSQEIVD